MKKLHFLTSLLILLCSVAYGQPALTNPNGFTDTYPAPNGNLEATSCRSMTNVMFNGGYYDFYVSGWSNNGSAGKIVWRIMYQNTNPPAVYNQGEFALNGSDIEVGILQINGSIFIVTGYNKTGVGFVFERYIWNGSNFVFFSTQTLSTLPGKKINMDMYGSWEMALVWTENTMPINVPMVKCMLANGLATTQIITLTGSDGAIHPDVALSKHSGAGPAIDGMLAHVVYTKANSIPGPPYGYNAQVIECVIPFTQVFNANPASYTPILEDVNNIPNTQILPQATIDCPDVCTFNPFANWAYVYRSDNGIEMRVVNQSAGVPPTTKNLVNGSDYANANIFIPNAHYAPTVAYGYMGQSIHVGWTFYGPPVVNSAGSLALEITDDGSSLICQPDYQLISTNYTAIKPQFSKNGLYAPFLYATFSENYNAGNTSLRHMFHMWGDPAFKGQPTGIANNNLKQEKINIAPNPFNRDVHFVVPAALTNEDITITMTDIIGRNLYSGTCKGEQLEATLQPNLNVLSAGTYLLNIASPALHYYQQQKLVKAE